ncbi:MAG: carbohydrate-binding protein [Firmicutes bacterium]|nr:carbohydrate-binding protein [Bacillota bacterium]
MAEAVDTTQLENGITLHPMPLTAGQKAVVRYHGLLARSGAQQVYLHCGFGSDDLGAWSQVQDIPMTNTPEGWEAQVDLTDPSRLHFCFRDNVGNWDNNSGRNWHVEIHNGGWI